jgi:hypothetical protein
VLMATCRKNRVREPETRKLIVVASQGVILVENSLNSLEWNDGGGVRAEQPADP